MTQFQSVPAAFSAYAPGAAIEAALAEPKMPTDVIAYGNNAPELSMRPMDWTAAAHPRAAIAQLKVDGIGAIHINGKMWSLQGTPLHCCEHLLDDMERLQSAVGYKLVVATEFEAGSFRDTISAMRRGKPGSGTGWVYDAVPYSQWCDNRFCLPLLARLNVLRDGFAAFDATTLGLLDSFDVTAEQVPGLVQRMETEGLEGIVVKDLQSLFTRNRSASWLRAKVERTYDGKVVGVSKTGMVVHIPGLGQHKVATGVTPQMKAEFIGDPSRWIGRTVEISCNKEAGTRQPRHCRFVRPREDKDC